MALLVGLAFPLGLYITKVMNGERIPGVSKVLTPCENLIYKVMRVKADEQMGWKKYLLSVVLFNLFGFLLLFWLSSGRVIGDRQNDCRNFLLRVFL